MNINLRNELEGIESLGPREISKIIEIVVRVLRRAANGQHSRGNWDVEREFDSLADEIEDQLGPMIKVPEDPNCTCGTMAHCDVHCSGCHWGR